MQNLFKGQITALDNDLNVYKLKTTMLRVLKQLHNQNKFAN